MPRTNPYFCKPRGVKTTSS